MITNDPMGIANATRQWDSLDALETVERKRFVLTEKERRCLNCPLKDCVDGCRGSRPRVVDPEALHRMHTAGMTDSAISRAMGVSVGAIYYHRKKMGLPANANGRPPRPTTR